MKRVAIVAAMIGIAAGIWFVVVPWFESDETRIERQLDTMIEAFNERRIKPIADRLTDAFREQTLDLDRAHFVAFALAAVRAQIPITVALDRDELTIDVDGDRARVDARILFERRRPGGAAETRPAVATLTFTRTDGDWMLSESRHTWPDGRLRR